MYGLYGQVENRTNGVIVTVDGDPETINKFCSDIAALAPPASRIKSIELMNRPVSGYKRFIIAESKLSESQITEVCSDIAVCNECIAELTTDEGRIDYPFINCTNCGPRFSIIRELPYDRPNTTMAVFKMCQRCHKEYNDILDRRFHAQPIACNSCGPEYLAKENGNIVHGIYPILNHVIEKIDSGGIIAVKGIGGYHLMCDALNEDAVKKLRIRKRRDAKPFAVMFSNIEVVKEYCFLTEEEEKELSGWQRPIVLLKQKKPLAESVSNGLATIGAMLPYMPFHFLLFRKLNTPVIVLTSGNLSDEPVIIDDDEAEKRLSRVADSIISYNRTIHNRVDDSVIRLINNKPSIIRRSRGFVPRPVDLSFNVNGIIGLGAEQKNSFSIGKDNQAIMSQFIGDLNNVETCDFYSESVDRFSLLFRFKPEFIACDLHPDYYTTRFATYLEKEYNIPVLKVQHHHAHVASCMAEHGIDEKVIGISMDGTGYGTDGRIWGGEFLIAGLEGFERFSHFDYVPLPGGDKASLEPWRMAFSYLYNYFGENLDYKRIRAFKTIGEEEFSLVKAMILNKINCPLSSGAGRLFDAVSALVGLCFRASFDSEAPMRLESAIRQATEMVYPYEMGDTIIFRETLMAIIDDIDSADISIISAKFHNTIAQVILDICEKIRKEHSLNKVIMSGGVFQNKYLLERSYHILTKNDFEVYSNNQVPSNDGGISLGQLVIASKNFGLCV